MGFGCGVGLGPGRTRVGTVVGDAVHVTVVSVNLPVQPVAHPELLKGNLGGGTGIGDGVEEWTSGVGLRLKLGLGSEAEYAGRIYWMGSGLKVGVGVVIEVVVGGKGFGVRAE